MHNSEFSCYPKPPDNNKLFTKYSMAALEKKLFEQFQDQKKNDLSNFKYLSRPNASNKDLVQLYLCFGVDVV